MTVKEVSKELGLKVRTVRQWLADGKLKAEKRGWYWYIPEEEIKKQEVRENADKAREHSRRIKKGGSMGMLHEAGQDTEESAEREECQE